MKKFISLFIFAILLFTACGNEVKTDGTSSGKEIAKEENKILLAGSFWAENSDYMAFLTDALRRNDKEYLQQLIIEKKVFFVDKNTLVKSFGYTADQNNELISFAEGRYTNKTGRTLKKFLLTEEEYRNREKKAREEVVSLIKKYFDETADYETIAKSSDYNYIDRFKELCSNRSKDLENLFLQDKYNNEINIVLKKASDIIGERRSAIFYGLKVLENSQKYSQELEKSPKKIMYKNLIQDFQKQLNKSIQKEKQLRQEFLSTYGF